ncbi:MAG TPA: DUF3299 domain-containing protein [Tepidisphaeraceae bacterium]|nr:DUF3299 domain-containing protein [Tepidisphaeraceae bacterium]
MKSPDLELRALQAFAARDYATALPLLVKLDGQFADQPDRQGQIREMINVCKTEIRQDPKQAARLAGQMPEEEVPSSPDTRKPHAAPADGQVRPLTIKELGNFEYDPDAGGNIPADVQRLKGSTVRISGYMIPMDQAERITQFALVPSLLSCCFGQPPQVQHTVIVRCPKGKAVGYYPDEVVVEGTLNVEEKKDDGFIISVFDLQASSVKPAAK